MGDSAVSYEPWMHCDCPVWRYPPFEAAYMMAVFFAQTQTRFLDAHQGEGLVLKMSYSINGKAVPSV